ncbi:hypothetical protein MAR_037695 [Mya arenaria]|uniref:CABIT domain-containing protein n=1 Tax=Mya arenaria TaxID=6604 RepID=A0ABY7FY05_MYAAR|nr:uncharacterized protein LOC128213576 [Mya arenaria]WAR24026.1 hypothetical protein MAR_037695 [Mya arenaria]
MATSKDHNKKATITKKKNFNKNKAKTINGILREGLEFPVLVTACNTDYEISDQFDLPDTTEILLDKIEHAQFAQIRALPFNDVDSVREQKGADTMKSRRQCEGLEFLVPVLYPGKLRYVDIPGHRTRFSSIQEVIESFPRHVKVESDMTLCEPYGVHGTGPDVPAMTILKPKRVYYDSCTKLRYLQCNAGDQEYHIREDEIVNMTSILDNNLYTLSDLKKDGALLACVQFNDVGLLEIVLKCREEACRLLEILSSPIEVIGFTSKAFVCAYVQEENEICRSVALIPESLWGKQQFHVHASKEMEDHVKKYFEMYKDNYWLRSSIYAVEATGPGSERLTWLRRPSDYLHVTSDPDNEPPPPIPKRRPVAKVKPEIARRQTTPSNPETEGRKTRRQVSISVESDSSSFNDIKLPIKKEEDRTNIVQKSKMGFKRIHSELLAMFSSKATKENQYRKRVHLKPLQQSKVKSYLERITIMNNSDKNTDSSVEPSSPVTPVSPQSQSIHPMASRTLPPLPEQSKPTTEASSVGLASWSPGQSGLGGLYNTQYDNDGADDGEEDTDRIYDEADDEQHDYLKPLMLEDLKKKSHQNQSSQEFYSYSVTEVSDCFKLCFSDKQCLGNYCAEKRLDGNFFQRFEDPSMVFEGIELSNIDNTKLKAIIHEGWRPKL